MLAVNLFQFFSRKLPISRLQRDLTDSTVLRNIGTVFGYIEVAYHNFLVGFNKINGDSSLGDLYRFNSMEDFSSFRTQLTYNF